MSNFKMRLKLTGLEIEIEGSRDEIPQMTRNIGQQLSGLLAPAAGIVAGEVAEADRRLAAAAPAVPADATRSESNGNGRRSGSRKRGKAPSGAAKAPGASSAADAVVVFTHDPARFGMPRQGWSTAKKALWLLYAVGEQGGPQELTAHQITATFNKQFREAKQVIIQNVARDLGKMRDRTKNAAVAMDNTMNPSPWYLTEAGRREAQGLVAQALTPGGADGEDADQEEEE